jgi:BASS family bile acid:Na+ symporter
MLIDVLIPLILVLLMVVVGTGLQAAQFAAALRAPVALLGGTALQIVLLPAVALALIELARPTLEIAAGLLLVSACPGGALSSFYCHLGKLNVAMSVSLTALSSVVGFVALPVVLALVFPLVVPAQEVAVPVGDLILRLLLLLLVPVAIGMLLRLWLPGAIQRSAGVLRGAGLVLVALLLCLIFHTQWEGATRLFEEAVWLSAMYALLALASGWLGARVLRQDANVRVVFAIEFAVRNAGVAAVVAAASLGRPEFVIFGALFVVVQFPLILLLLRLNRKVVAAEHEFPGSGR